MTYYDDDIQRSIWSLSPVREQPEVDDSSHGQETLEEQ